MRSAKDLLKPARNPDLITFKNPAWVVMLFLFGSGFIVQGCVVHSHDNRHARHKTKIYSNKNYPRHKQPDAHHHDRASKVVKKIPSYAEQLPTHAHQPPAHAKAHDVAKGKPFTEDEHPSSHGQGHKAEKGKPHWGDDHPSAKGQDRKMGPGKPDKGDPHPSAHAKADKGKPLWGDEHPSSKGQDHNKGQDHKAKKEKPLWGDESPASKGPDRKMNLGKPDKAADHSSVHAKAGQAKPLWGDEHPAPKGQNHKAEKGKPLLGNESPSSHAKNDQEPQGGPRQGKHPTSAQLDTSKGKPMMDAPPAKRPDSSPMKPRGKPDKGGPKSKDRPQDRFAASPVEENMPSESFSQPGNKGRSTKKDSMSSPAPSGNPDFQPVESSPEPRENVQIAKAEPVRGKGPSKLSGKPSKPGKGKPNRAPEQTAALTPPEPTTPMAAPETSTASLAPTVFDANQRNIIQSYYQNTRSSPPSKGKSRGKSSRGFKRNKTGSVARNEILTQPTEPLPRALESQLPPAPPNTQRAVYNQQVVLLERGTHRVLDVINVNN